MGAQDMIVYDIYVGRDDEVFREFTTDSEREAMDALGDLRAAFGVAPGSRVSVWLEEREVEDT